MSVEARRACYSLAETTARDIRIAIQRWQATNNETSYPTISQLVQEKFLGDQQQVVDPWGSSYTLSCLDDDVQVISGGPDMRKGTADDVAIPRTSLR